MSDVTFFSYKKYISLLETIKNQGYQFVFFDTYLNYDKFVIIRHDVDFSLKEAYKLAEIENLNEVKSTFFFLISSDFYNLYSKKSQKFLINILELGHDIGLHFDETRYNNYTNEKLVIEVINELKILENIIGRKINKISMHRPSKKLLESNLIFGENIINTYSEVFFKEIKYLSDSRMRWRENPFDLISSNTFDKLQLLIHPIWYTEIGLLPKEIFINLFKDFSIELYKNIENNFTNIQEYLTIDDIIEEE